MHNINSEHPYDQLTPDFVLDAVESIGLETDSRILSLNSYENRVYQVGIEESLPLIAKFYRPFRWTKEAILEEHQFTQNLLAQDISVVSPLEIQGATLHHFQGFYFTLFPRQGGHAPEVDNADTLFRIGRNIGRIHQSAGEQIFEHRKTLSVQEWATESRQFLLENDFIPSSLIPAYETLSKDIIEKIKTVGNLTSFKPIKLHGDCHLGNIIRRGDASFHLIDLDDMVMGPEVQDIWLAIPGVDQYAIQDRAILLEAYETMRPFPREQQCRD